MRRSFGIAIAVLVLVSAAAMAGCAAGNSISGEVRFHRDIDLPAGATVTVTLQGTSLADASAIELGRDEIADVERLPVRIHIEYDGDALSIVNDVFPVSEFLAV